jgi:hypothetical protein
MRTPVLKEPYQRRAVRYLDQWRIDDWSLKAYGITHRGELPGQDLQIAARSTVATAIRTGELAGYGVGWVTVHDARGGVFVVLDWWADENMLHQRLWTGPGDASALVPAPPDHAITCVWELAVCSFERTQWVRHILTNPGGPSIEAYLQERLHDDV